MILELSVKETRRCRAVPVADTIGDLAFGIRIKHLSQCSWSPLLDIRTDSLVSVTANISCVSETFVELECILDHLMRF